jgi:hypothetical protein
MNDDFKPYEDWTPDGDKDDDRYATLYEAFQLQQQQIAYLQQLTFNHNEQIRKLIEIAQAIHQRQEHTVEALKAIYEYVVSVSDAVKAVRTLQVLQNAKSE